MPRQPNRGETKEHALEKGATSISTVCEFTVAASSLKASAIFLSVFSFSKSAIVDLSLLNLNSLSVYGRFGQGNVLLVKGSILGACLATHAVYSVMDKIVRRWFLSSDSLPT